jgi:EAL domain-containing protein (putative c-di-GMP-specific phosphodiesterase class I)
MAELAAIKKMGGEIIQGYLFSKPISANEAIEWTESVDTAKHA